MYGEDEGLQLFLSVVAYVDHFDSRHSPFLTVLSAEQVGEFKDSTIPDSCSVFRVIPRPYATWSGLTTRGTVLEM
jgi:hypothetical protein